MTWTAVFAAKQMFWVFGIMPWAYCAEKHATCETGMTFVDGQCISSHPQTLFPPTFSGPHQHEDDFLPYFTFDCEIHIDPNQQLMGYAEVLFLFDGDEDNIEDPNKRILRPPKFILNMSSDANVASLHERYLRGRLGRMISCKACAFSEADNGTCSPYVTSRNHYWAGVKTEESTPISITPQAPQKEIHLIPTIPINCPNSPMFDPPNFCNVQAHITTSNMAHGCMPAISSQQYPGFQGEPLTLPRAVTGNCITVSQIEGTKSSGPAAVTFLSMTSSFFPGWDSPFDGYIPDEINVDLRTCESSCMIRFGGGISTIDGESFSCSYEGDFLLWSTGDERIGQVQVSTWDIPDRAGSVGACGVIVREGNSVLGLSLCFTRRNPVLQKIEYTVGSNTRAGDIEQLSAKEWTINLQSGSYVEVVDCDTWLDIIVFPIDRDRTISHGLCGDFDDDPRNDDSNCLNYQLETEESLFVNPAQCRNYSVPSPQACDCQGHQTAICSLRRDDIPDRIPYYCDESEFTFNISSLYTYTKVEKIQIINGEMHSDNVSSAETETENENNIKNSSSTTLNAGVIGGTIAGLVLVLALGILIIFLVFKQQKRRRHSVRWTLSESCTLWYTGKDIDNGANDNLLNIPLDTSAL